MHSFYLRTVRYRGKFLHVQAVGNCFAHHEIQIQKTIWTLDPKNPNTLKILMPPLSAAATLNTNGEFLRLRLIYEILIQYMQVR